MLPDSSMKLATSGSSTRGWCRTYPPSDSRLYEACTCILAQAEPPGQVPMMKNTLPLSKFQSLDSHSWAFLSAAVIEPLYSGQAIITASASRTASRRVSASAGIP